MSLTLSHLAVFIVKEEGEEIFLSAVCLCVSSLNDILGLHFTLCRHTSNKTTDMSLQLLTISCS